MKNTESQKSTILSRMEELTKVGLFLFGLIYALGFIVVALHLARYRVSPLSLVRVQYILAGIWLLLPLAAMIIIFSWIGAMLHDEYRTTSETPTVLRRKIWFHVKKIGHSLFAVYGWFCISAVIIFLIAQQFGANLDFSYHSLMTGLKVISIIIFLGIVIVFNGLVSWFFLKDVTVSSLKDTFNNLVWGITFASFGVLVVLGYIGYFTFSVYYKIPSVLGGGAPVQVRFFLKKDSIELKATSIIKVTNENLLSEPYSLLLSTEKTYVVLDPNDSSQAIEISKDIVNGVIISAK